MKRRDYKNVPSLLLFICFLYLLFQFLFQLEVLGKMYNSDKITHAVIEFVDIAGLVKGASRGEGLGNKFFRFGFC